MPKPSQKTGAQLSKRAKQGEISKNKRVAMALDDQSAFFGRVLKINMNRCTVTLWDHERGGHYEIQATLPNKKKGFIQINDIVNLAKSNPDWEIQVSIDRKTAASLHKEKRITDAIFNEIEVSKDPRVASGTTSDIGFDFEYDALADSSNAAPEVRFDEKKINDEIDIDIDAI